MICAPRRWRPAARRCPLRPNRKLAALLLKQQLGDFKKMLDANEVGGTALLGISKPVVKAHGSASEVGICNAVRQAMEVARSGIIDDIAQNIDKMRIEQKAE